MVYSYAKVILAALLPVIAAAVIYILEKRTAFSKIQYKYKQLIIGLIFGGLAVIGTEYGIPMNGAQMNCRDAAVLSAGLFFGAPAGVIAGIIGAVERWFAVYHGVGATTQLACTVSTFLAGIYSALLRKYMFENKKPSAFISLAVGVVMEVFHMTTIFLTTMYNPEQAVEIVRVCSPVMIPANGLSVMLTAVVISLFSREKFVKHRNQTRISQTIQRWLLLSVTLAFLFTSSFVFRFQDEAASRQADQLLSLAVDETSADIIDASDENLLNLAYEVKKSIETEKLDDIVKSHNLSEINIVDKNGIIVKSNVKDYIGYDMSTGRQSAEFLRLLGNNYEYVQDFGPISTNESISRKYAGVKTDDGFLQVGYDRDNLKNDVDKEVIGITKNRHVGKTGCIMILDSQLNIISAPPSMKQKNLLQSAPRIEIPNPDTTFSMNIDGQDCRCRYRLAEGYYIFSVLPEAEAVQMRNIAAYVNSFMEILVFAILFILIYLLIKKVVVSKIKSINNSLAKITGGNLDTVVNVRSNEEFSSLSDDINSTVDTLKQYIEEASARIDAELEFAKNIQASALPNVSTVFSKRTDFDIFASMNPAKEVGGDFYDAYITKNDTLNFLIADVSGKGIPAAMFMMRAMTELKSLTEAGQPINEVFTNSNNALCEGNDAGMFVTAWQGGIDLSDGTVRFANAGHNPPLVKHKGGEFEYLKSRAGFVLAGMDGIRYRTQELQLEPDDIIYLYTDGVTEATNSADELYGEERLRNALNSREFATMEELCEFIKADVDTFVGEADQFDDITMVAIKYVGIPSITIDEAEISDVQTVTEFIESELEKINCPMKAVMQINIAIDELFSNIVKYGYPDKKGSVTVKFIHHSDPKSVFIRFEDDGIPYNPLTKEDPDVTLSADERDIGGLGVFVVKKTMDDMRYKYENGKNILTIKKLI